MDITIEFKGHSKRATDAIQDTATQCEAFLEMLNGANINLNEVHIGEHSVTQRRIDNEKYTQVSKELKLRLPFNMPFANHIMETVRKNNYSADVDFDYRISNKQELHNELLKEALADSRRKAEFIAEAVGQKIIGIENVEHESYDKDNWHCEERELPLCSEQHLSDLLQAPLSIEAETIEVIWIIE